MEKTYIKNPKEIEIRSFEIIGEEMTPHDFSPEELKIIKRVIHTTADFTYQDLVKIHPDAIRKGIQALKAGCDIYADTNMIASGVSLKNLERLDCRIYSLVRDERVAQIAKEKSITRSMAGIDACYDNERVKIFMVGNAPTALYRILEQSEETGRKPELIIGVPVGFVGAAESKKALVESDHTYITVEGRKGGSTVAVSILNALLYMIEDWS